VCQPAPACSNGQDDCTPYGLLCNTTTDYCTNPTPCVGGAGGTCAVGYECNDNLNPPGCLPEGTAGCTRDDMCPAGQYCELFNGQCAPGCRNDADCAGQCGGATPCVCDGTRVCSDNSLSNVCLTRDASGCSSCADDSGCPGGSVCAKGDFLTCTACALAGACPPECTAGYCRQVCDGLTSIIIDTCPGDTQCGGPGSGDPIADLFMAIFTALLNSSGGGGGNASACY
jgi:hypothetical protein